MNEHSYERTYKKLNKIAPYFFKFIGSNSAAI
jgi:hypothetical protein